MAVVVTPFSVKADLEMVSRDSRARRAAPPCRGSNIQTVRRIGTGESRQQGRHQSGSGLGEDACVSQVCTNYLESHTDSLDYEHPYHTTMLTKGPTSV